MEMLPRDEAGLDSGGASTLASGDGSGGAAQIRRCVPGSALSLVNLG
jgi:hypothetical protein